MQRKVVKKNGYNAGKGKANQELIYLHMSNHYRRILNAKKVVDSSPPQCYKTSKPKRPATTNSAPPKIKLNRPLESPALTDRSVSTNSCKGSYWGTDSCLGSSRYHSNCVPSDINNANATRHNRRPEVDMNLIDRITFDTKNGPSAYCDETWIEEKDQYHQRTFQPAFLTNNMKTATTAAHSSASREQIQSHPAVKIGQESGQKQKFIIQKKLNSMNRNKEIKVFGTPKVSKIEAVSKLRSMRVYHPPRRRKARNKIETPNTLVASECNCPKICVCDATEPVFKKEAAATKEQSQTSSRDSAYNGGVSSLPESRTPTPDHEKKQKHGECCCCCCYEKKHREKNAEGTKNTKDRVGPPKPSVKTPRQEDSLRRMKEDALYVKFIQDITVEVLEKNLYTNKALKKVMKKHLRDNLHKLNKERMLAEVENLRIQLGIPEDKALLDVEADAEETCSDAFRPYPIISDSEFSLPKNLNSMAEIGKSSLRMPKSISEVLEQEQELEQELERELEHEFSSDSDDDDLISVVQAKKAVAEKRREKAATRGHFSDDSDRPSQPKKRSTGKMPEKHSRRYSTSSSDSETSGEKFTRKACGGGCGHECSCLGRDRKRRTVSFWSSPDLKGQGVGCRAGSDNVKA